ncbi:Ig-like domain-containing protein, partial [Serratia sp. MMO-151]
NMTSGSATDDPTPTLSGRAEANSIVKVYDQNGLLGSAQTDASGQWSFTPTSKLAEGEHRFTVTATDKAGNVSDPSNTFTLILDFTPPDASKVVITGVDDQVGEQKGNVVAGGTTDDNRPTIKGTGAEAGNTITVYNGSTVIGTALVQADGTWSLKPTLPLADGLATLTAKESDQVGNTTVASPEYAITVVTVPPQAPTITSVEDNVEPHTGALQKGDITNDNTPTLKGSALPGGTVTVYDNGTAIGSVKADNNGAWSFTPSTPLGEGNHSLTASVTDSIGQVSPTTGGFGIVVDTLPPAPVTGLVVTDDYGNVQGPLTAGSVTDDNTPTFSGKAEAGSVVNVLDNGKVIGSTTVDSNGNWSFTPSTPLDNGAHDFTTTVTDKAGNTSAEGQHLAVTVDAVPGQVQLTGLADDVGDIQGAIAQNGVTDDTRPTLSGTAKANSVVTVSDGDTVLGSTTAKADGTWSFTPAVDLGQGAHSLSASAKDPAGSISNSGNWAFTVDSVAPNAPFIDSAADDVGSVQPQNMTSGSATDDPTPTLSGRAEANSIVKVYDQNGLLGSAQTDASGQWSFTPTSKLAEGEHRFTVTATDKAGNVSDPSNTFTLTLDFTPPDASKIAITGVTDNVGSVTGPVDQGGILDDRKPVIKGTGAEAGDTITVSTTDADGNTKVLGTTTVGSDGTWELTSSGSLYDGLNKLTVVETDKVGNTAKPDSSYNVTLSLTPGAPTIDSIVDDSGATHVTLAEGALTKDNTPTLSGTSSVAEGDTITIYNGNTVVGTTTAGPGGNWSFTPTTKLPDGAYSFSVTGTNSAGQESAHSGSQTITIDATPPNPVSGLTVNDDVGSVQGPLANGAVSDDNTPTFKGNAETGSTVTIYANGDAIGSVTVTSPDGSWVYTPTTALPDGNYQFATEVTDKAGNSSGKVEGIAITVDTVPGDLKLLQVVDNVEPDGGSRLLNNGDVTNDSTPTFVGTATAGSIITLKEGASTVLGSVKVDASGNWTFEPSTVLSEGVHNFVVSGVDAGGNPLTPINFSLTIDTVAPGAPNITDVVDNTLPVLGTVLSGHATNDTTPEIKGTAEKDSTVQIYNQIDATNRVLLGTALADTNGQWVLILTDDKALTDGSYTLVAVATDKAGNVGAASAPWTIIIDTAISDATIAITSISDDLGVSDTDFNTSDNTLLINGTLNKALQADEWVEVSVDGGKTWTKAASTTASTWTVDLQSQPLDSGNYTIDARVVDQAGNIGSTDSHALTIATGGPNLNGLTTTTGITTDTSNGLVSGDLFSHSATATNNDMVTRDRTVTLNGNLSAALQANQYLQISLDNGTTWKTLLSQSGSQWNYTLDAVTQSTTVDYQLRVIDSAGNLGTNTHFANSYQVVIDLEAPDAILGAPNVPQIVDNTTTFVFNSSQYGKVEAGAIVSLVSDVNRNGTYQEGLDQVIGFAKANADGTWALSTTLPSGAHNIAFMVWDDAGNRSAMSSSTSIGVTDGGGSTLIEQKWGGTTDAEGYGLNAAAVTISQDGLWSFFQSVRGTSGTTTANAGRVYNATSQEDYTSTYLAQPSTTNGAGYNVNDAGYGRFINSATFADINRDGLTDVMSQVSSYGNANRTAYWMQNADGSYTPQALNQGTLNHLGGVIAYDREGDGYLDFVLADSESDSISFIKNVNGVLTYEQASGFAAGHPGGAIPSALSVLHEVGAVDIDNNGTVDITAHIDYNGAGTYAGNGSRGLGIIYNQTNGTTSTTFGQVGYYANVFRSDGATDYGNLSISMTYADYNGDGWLDLFLSRGAKNAVDGNESRIYLNDGTGKLMATDAQALWFGDSLDGGTSLAVDWNHDGKMDIIEVPRSGVTGSPVLYLNQGNNVWGTNAVSLTSQTYNNLTGAVALDYDWDGSMDLVLYRSGADAAVVSGDAAAPTLLVKNTNIAADGTSLQIRIVDGNGINTFYSNTVKLYDSHGNLVATQLINPQASGSSNSMGLVSFFGLNPDEVYSVQLLRITNGAANHVGAFAGEQGGNINTTVNENWGGLTTGKAHDAYVLTAENTNDVNNTIGASGITGTGYNDTFFSSAGDDTYTGGGGWNQVVSGQAVWSATAGMDIVDYSRAPGAVMANLWTGTATGHGNDKLVSIEGLIGSNQGDTFTDNSANNLFEGRGGNDTFYLMNGGNDTLMYKVLAGLESDGTGGNGHDTVHGFKVGNVVTDSDADLIDLSDLLDYNGPISFFQDDGKMELDYSSQGILKYLKVETSGNDTVISIDRDGQGGQYAFTNVVTLANVHTDLETLLQNNQIIV